MKFLAVQLSYLLGEQKSRRNLRTFFRLLALLVGLISVYSVLFHWIMLLEGQEHTWFTGFYWSLTVMSTLGFGDITFHTDLGRAFSMVVLVSGLVLLLIVMPFAFITFFYAPWLQAHLHTRAPREAREGLTGHVVLCHYDEMTRGLIERCTGTRIIGSEGKVTGRINDTDVRNGGSDIEACRLRCRRGCRAKHNGQDKDERSFQNTSKHNNAPIAMC